MKLPRLRLALVALSALAISLIGCGPSAEEQAGADRMQRGIDASRDAMKAPQAGMKGGAPAPTR